MPMRAQRAGSSSSARAARSAEATSGVCSAASASTASRVYRELTRRGFYSDKIDGKAGMLTRAALGAYQKANKLPLDCWPSQTVLDHMLAK